MNQKVIIIGPAFPFRGGIANFNNALANAYNTREDEVTLFSFVLQYPSFFFLVLLNMKMVLPPKGLNIIPIINSINPFNWVKVARKVNEHKPD